MSARTWLITGCSSGIGRTLATRLVESGERVVATARKAEQIADIAALAPERAIALPLDVADPEAGARAVAEGEARLGAIDVLVSNAGYGYVSAIEEGDEAAVKAMFETNFFGAWRMARAVLPGMRARGRGHIIFISSLAGRIANPATGFYSASKHALEAMSGALGRELAGSGIKVTAIAPGGFATDFNGRSLKVGETEIETYRDTAHARIGLVKSQLGMIGDVEKLVDAVRSVPDMVEPPLQLLLGSDAFGAVSARMDEQRASIEANRALTVGTDLPKG